MDVAFVFRRTRGVVVVEEEEEEEESRDRPVAAEAGRVVGATTAAPSRSRVAALGAAHDAPATPDPNPGTPLQNPDHVPGE